MIVGGVILPHPPLILPEFAAQRGPEVDRTIAATQRAARWVASLRPERFVVSSPHDGHGFTVPLSFLGEALGELPPIERILTDEPSYAYYRDLGARRRARQRGDERVVLVASGDCSHRLREDGPYGFHALGAELDRRIVDAVARADPDALLAIAPTTLAEGAECGVRSFVFALAALRPARAEVLSYEGPYGVGYIVATLAPLPLADEPSIADAADEVP